MGRAFGDAPRTPPRAHSPTPLTLSHPLVPLLPPLQAPPNKETATTEKELELLQVVWGMWDEWEAKMTGWKYGKFKEIDVTAIENDAAQVTRRRCHSHHYHHHHHHSHHRRPLTSSTTPT